MPRILIVDDTPDILSLLSTYFEVKGVLVDTAVCGEDALFRYHTARQDGHPYDVVVLDIAMSPITGLTVARKIRETGDDKTKLIFFTGYDSACNQHAAEDVAAAAYITKPASTEDLHAAIKDALQST